MPVSIATIRGPGLSGSRMTASVGVTSRARSWPSIGGSARTRSIASPSGVPASNRPPRIAPLSRMWRTSARVSTPLSAGMPQSDSQVSQPPSAVAACSRSIPSRMITARVCTESDSVFAAFTP